MIDNDKKKKKEKKRESTKPALRKSACHPKNEANRIPTDDDDYDDGQRKTLHPTTKKENCLCFAQAQGAKTVQKQGNRGK